MIDEYHQLVYHSLPAGTRLRRSDSGDGEEFTLESNAALAMTDFRHVRPFTISPTATIADINAKMIACGVRLLFVSEVNDVLLGLVTYNDIFGDKPVRYIQEHGGSHDEIVAQDIMTSVNMLEALEQGEVNRKRVGDIVETMKSSRRQHVLVTDSQPDGVRFVSGLFSSTDIGKRLGIEIELSARANTFADLERALNE